VIVKHWQLENVEVQELQLKLDAEIMKLQHVKEDVLHQHHQELHQQHVIAKLKLYLNVDLKELLQQLHVETMKSKIANKDAHQQIHVIAKHQQLENAEVQELLQQLDVEITKLQHVQEDVLHQHHQDLFHQHQELLQHHVIVMHKQYLNVDQE